MGGQVLAVFLLPYFRRFSRQRRTVIIEELIRLTTIMVMKVRNKIPDVLDRVTHMLWSASWSRVSSIIVSLKFCDEGSLKATSSGLRT